jgi:subtilisin family serine protease
MAKAARYEPGDPGRRPLRSRPVRTTRGSALEAASIESAATVNGPRPTVVFVHGIGRQERPAVLKNQYEVTLFGRDLGERGRLAYWADLLHPESDIGGGMAARQFGAAQGRAADLGEDLLDELVRRDPSAATFVESLSRRLSAEPPTMGNDAVVARAYQRSYQAESERKEESALRGASVQASPAFNAKILPTEWLRQRVTRWVTQTFLTDVAAYFFDRDLRERIQDRLRAVLVPNGGPYVIVSHSLGTVIAYDILREAEATGSALDIPLWVTLGSPLGIEEVQDNLAKPLRVPGNVRRWRNFSDRLDPVAFDATLQDDFSGGDLEDLLVVNLDTPRLTGFNPHSALGYLGHSAVKQTVLPVVGADFAAATPSFVMARNLASELAGSPRRLPVLIQLDDALGGDQLVEKRENVCRKLRELVANESEAHIDDSLRRYVAADLTPTEVEQLLACVRNENADTERANRTLCIHRLWKNSTKKALTDVSRHRVQVAPAEAAYQATGKGIAWAVLDTGINASHPHFDDPSGKSLIDDYWDCCGPHQLEPNPKLPKTPEKRVAEAADSVGHGTHVAGIIAGRQPEGYDSGGRHGVLRGMAPDCHLHIYKVLDDSGSGQDSWIIKALDHIASVNERAAELVIHGVNLSLGGPFDADVFGCGHSPLCAELRRLWRMGVIVCIAAGNEGFVRVEALGEGERELNLDLSIGDPANLEDAIAVGSVNKDFPHLYGVSYFSSRGPTADGRPKPDVVAPGEKIWSCNATNRPNSLYIQSGGTSMACPHVSGLLAAFLSVRREFIGRPDEVKRLLLQHAIDLGRDRYHQGAGMPNLLKMLVGT